MSKEKIGQFVQDVLKFKDLLGMNGSEPVELNKKRTLVDHLIGLRNLAGLSREEIARRMGTDIFKVISLESLTDQEDMTLGDFRKYVEALGLKAVARIERRVTASKVTGGL